MDRNNLILQLRRYKRQKPLVLDDDDDANAEEYVDGDYDHTLPASSSSWSRTAENLIEVLDSNVTVIYLDFVSDVEQMTELLNKSVTSAMKYTGHMKLDDRVLIERRFLKGEAPVLVATEAYELGVDNPNITQVVRIGCPRNIDAFIEIKKRTCYHAFLSASTAKLL